MQKATLDGWMKLLSLTAAALLLSGCGINNIPTYDEEVSAAWSQVLNQYQRRAELVPNLVETVKGYAGLTGGERVLDLYSGTGTISICLAPAAGEVTGIEIAESSVADAVKNSRRNRIDNCRFLLGDILDVMPRVSDGPDVLIIDPPRSGMHKKVVQQVLDMGAPRVVYVSCNPATLARDLGLMKEHYSVREVQPVDMFPHTYHIEAVARLEKK